MATKINMLKLLQEVRGFAQFATRAGETRPTGPLLLRLRGSLLRKGITRRKYIIRIDMQEQPNIPQPVPITHIGDTR
jgi:hypothetical protein